MARRSGFPTSWSKIWSGQPVDAPLYFSNEGPHRNKAEGPTAGTATVDPLEFLARLVTHIPEPGQVMQRYSG